MDYTWLKDVVSTNDILDCADDNLIPTGVEAQQQRLKLPAEDPTYTEDHAAGDSFAVDLIALLSPSKQFDNETKLAFCRDLACSPPESPVDAADNRPLHDATHAQDANDIASDITPPPADCPTIAPRQSAIPDHEESLPPLVDATGGAFQRGFREAQAWGCTFEDACPVLEEDCPSQDIDAALPEPLGHTALYADPADDEMRAVPPAQVVPVEGQMEVLFRSMQDSWLQSNEAVCGDFEGKVSTAQLWAEVQRLQLENQQLKEVNSTLQRQQTPQQQPQSSSGSTGMNATAAAWRVSPLMQVSSPVHQAMSPLHDNTATGTPLSPVNFTATPNNSTRDGRDVPQLFPVSPVSEASRRDYASIGTPTSPLIEGLEKPDSQIDKAKLKTKLCKYFMQTQSEAGCPFYGRHGWCAFAHGEKELLTPFTPMSPILPLSPTAAFVGQDFSTPLSPFSMPEPSSPVAF